MPNKRPSEPIGPATIPGERLDPRIPDDLAPEESKQGKPKVTPLDDDKNIEEGIEIKET
jgi:hypothetical protein